MELRHLIYFEAVARHQHVSRAAAELAIAQPSLSKQIHDLEQELGIALFERIGRNIRLTDAGRAFLVHARAILAAAESARMEMQERAGLRRGRVVFGVPPTVGTRLLPDALAAFHEQYPAIDLCIREAGTQALLTLLKSGELDLAVATLPVRAQGVEITTLFSEELLIVVPLSHRLAGQQTICFTELSEESFLLYPEGYEMRDITLAACRNAGFIPRIVLDGGETDMLIRLAAAGLGIALIPRLALDGSVGLVGVSVVDQQLQRTMALIWRDGPSAPAVEALRVFLESYLLSDEHKLGDHRAMIGSAVPRAKPCGDGPPFG